MSSSTSQQPAQNGISPKPKNISILFVCLGNICRSPMAEGVFRALTHNLPDSEGTSSSSSTASKPRPRSKYGKDDDDIVKSSYTFTIDSAGTGAYHALSPPDPRTLAELKRHGITSYDHAARKVRASDFYTFDFLFAMDSENLEDLNDARDRLVKQRGKKSGEKLGRVLTFGDRRFGGVPEDEEGEGEEVVDPYYGGKDGFETAYQQVHTFSRGFLNWLEKTGGVEEEEDR